MDAGPWAADMQGVTPLADGERGASSVDRVGSGLRGPDRVKPAYAASKGPAVAALTLPAGRRSFAQFRACRRQRRSRRAFFHTVPADSGWPEGMRREQKSLAAGGAVFRRPGGRPGGNSVRWWRTLIEETTSSQRARDPLDRAPRAYGMAPR